LRQTTRLAFGNSVGGCGARVLARGSFRKVAKPSEKAARQKSEAIRRARKLARKQAIREGLIAAPVKKAK
jgi:small subunit ribosomal protein S21